MTSDALNAKVMSRIQQSIAVKQALQADAAFLDMLTKVAEKVAEAFRESRKILLFGNGGSAADAQHLAAEFAGRFLRERRPLPAIALTTNTSALTAIGNDYSFDMVFVRQLESLAQSGDVALGLSTSGNSKNVVQAMVMARQKNLLTVALTGADGGELKKIVDYCLCMPSAETPRIQEAHILVGHVLCELIEDALFD